MTAEQKELMKDGKMRMQLNVKEKVFKMDLNIPYKNFASLQKLLSSGGATGNVMSEMNATASAPPEETTGVNVTSTGNRVPSRLCP